MVILKWTALAVLAILGVLGGLRLTGFVRYAICEHRAERVARHCMPCTCGNEDIAVHTTDTGKAVVIQCPHCYRYVCDGDLVLRWNNGEDDNNVGTDE